MDKTYPEIAEAIKDQDPENFIIDGEIVAFDGKITSFSKIQTRMNLKGPEEITEWTDTNKLRHPGYLGLRRRKKPEEMIKEN